MGYVLDPVLLFSQQPPGPESSRAWRGAVSPSRSAAFLGFLVLWELRPQPLSPAPSASASSPWQKEAVGRAFGSRGNGVQCWN